MQTAQLLGITRLAEALEAGYPTSESNLIRTIQTIHNQTPCFRSEVRYTCKNIDCEWLLECKRLVAEWRRGD